MVLPPLWFRSHGPRFPWIESEPIDWDDDLHLWKAKLLIQDHDQMLVGGFEPSISMNVRREELTHEMHI